MSAQGRSCGTVANLPTERFAEGLVRRLDAWRGPGLRKLQSDAPTLMVTDVLRLWLSGWE